MKLLIVVDMQKDFVDGALGTPEAQAAIDTLNRELLLLFPVPRSKGNTHGDDVRRARELISEATEILFRL